MLALGGNLQGSWLDVLALVRLGASWVEKFCVSFGRNVWEFVDYSSLVARRLRKITRKFNKLSSLRVSVLAVFAWLAWCIGLCGAAC